MTATHPITLPWRRSPSDGRMADAVRAWDAGFSDLRLCAPRERGGAAPEVELSRPGAKTVNKWLFPGAPRLAPENLGA